MLPAVELLGMCAFLTIGITQIVIPLWCGKKIFYKWRQKSFEETLQEAQKAMDILNDKR